MSRRWCNDGQTTVSPLPPATAIATSEAANKLRAWEEP